MSHLQPTRIRLTNEDVAVFDRPDAKIDTPYKEEEADMTFSSDDIKFLDEVDDPSNIVP